MTPSAGEGREKEEEEEEEEVRLGCQQRKEGCPVVGLKVDTGFLGWGHQRWKTDPHFCYLVPWGEVGVGCRWGLEW